MDLSRLIQKASTLGGDITWISLKDGVNKVRIVCRPGDDEPWRECFRHFLHRHIKVDFPNKAPICLGDISICPACQFVERLRKSGEERDADMARAQRRFIFAAFSRDNPFNDAGEVCVKLLECPPTVFQGLGKVAQEWDMDFTDPDEGFDVEIMRNSQSGGGFTKYEVRPETKQAGASRSIVQKPLTEEEKQLVSDAFPDFDAQTAPPDPMELAAVLDIELGEPPVSLPSRANAAPAPTETAAETAPDADVPSDQCLLYGEGWEDDDSCRECDLATECKELTLKKQRKPVKTPQ